MNRLQSQRKKNIVLVDKINNVLSNNSNIGVFNFNELTVGNMEFIRKQARESNSKLLIIKNTILNKCLKEQNMYAPESLKEKIFITYSNNPASCVSFLSNIPKQIKNITPVCVIHKNKNVLENVALKNLIKMRDEMGIKISLINILKSLPVKLIKILKIASEENN